MSSPTFLPFLRTFSVEDYYRMIPPGILREGARIELIEGLIVDGARQTPKHATARHILGNRLEKLPLKGWEVYRRLVIDMPESQPEPDTAIIRGTVDDYDERHPIPAEVGLVAEVADTSLAFDREVKMRVYARAGIVEYWIVNVVDRQIEVYTQPSGPAAAPAYAQRRDYKPGDHVPLTLDGVTVGTIAVSEVLH